MNDSLDAENFVGVYLCSQRSEEDEISDLLVSLMLYNCAKNHQHQRWSLPTGVAEPENLKTVLVPVPIPVPVPSQKVKLI